MYPLYFYICFLASIASVTLLILLAIFPVHLPIVAKTIQTPKPMVKTRKARSPTPRPQPVTYWDPPWDDDDEDL